MAHAPFMQTSMPLSGGAGQGSQFAAPQPTRGSCGTHDAVSDGQHFSVALQAIGLHIPASGAPASPARRAPPAPGAPPVSTGETPAEPPPPCGTEGCPPLSNPNSAPALGAEPLPGSATAPPEPGSSSTGW